MAKKVAISTFLDPELPAFGGRQYPNGKNIFGLFADASPDRWGRVLMNKRERIIAEKEKRKPKKLHDSDYLMGVYDENDETGISEKWLNQLLKPGSSLGGARPKATVVDTKRQLWIAKFPSKNDENDTGAWVFKIRKHIFSEKI